MKPLSVFLIFGLCGTAVAQSPQGSESNLRELRFDDPRGDLIVRYGQPPPRAPESRPEFSALDRNTDGSVDAAEARSYLTLANDFDYADTNNDGRISRREFDRW
jgi:hypothetical protein